MSEHSATQTLRTHLKAAGGHVQRFEDKLSPGIPDTNVCLRGVEFWLEGKFVKELPSKDTTLIRFGSKGEERLVHQRNWLTTRAKAGGRAFWWVRVRDAGWYLFNADEAHWLVEGIEKRVLLDRHDYGSAKALVEELNLMAGLATL